MVSRLQYSLSFSFFIASYFRINDRKPSVFWCKYQRTLSEYPVFTRSILIRVDYPQIPSLPSRFPSVLTRLVRQLLSVDSNLRINFTEGTKQTTLGL